MTPLDLTVQPWITKMLMPADGKALAAAIPEFTSGLATGYLGAKQSQRAADVAAGETPSEPSRFERFIQAANPTERRTVDETLSMDLGTMSKELGTLKTSDELFGWIKNNSALAASPIGNRMLTVIGQTAQRMSQMETESIGHITAKQLAIKKADLMVKYNLGPDATPEDFGRANARENEESFMFKASKEMGKDVSGRITSQDFDATGNWIPGAMQRVLEGAPLSQSIQSRERLFGQGLDSRERIAETRSQLMADAQAVRNDLAAGRLDVSRANAEIDRINTQLRQVDQQIRARGQGVEIENAPVIPPSRQPSASAPRPDAFDGVTVTPLQPSGTNAAPTATPAPTLRTVERPLTTANVTALQKADFEADSALVRLDILKRTIKENPDAFGVVGVGKEFGEVLAGITNPNADASITKARQEAGLTFVELAESLRTDTGNMSRWEQERLKDLGDTRSWKDNPARALAKADTIQKLVIGKKLRAMKALRASPDDNFLRQIEKDSDVIGLYQSGLLTLEDAKRWQALKPETTP